MLRMKNFVLFAVTIVFMFIVDIIWIGAIAMPFYRAQLGTLLADTINWPAALLFYVLYAIALLVLVIKPALEEASLKRALMYGALVGFTAYMTYDLTNLATTRDWPLVLSLVDMAWGTFLTMLVSVVVYGIGRKLRLG